MNTVCKRCSAPLPAGSLVCKHCHALVHAVELEQLRAAAKMMEEQRDFAQAKQHWSKALTLLPADSKQASWIAAHIEQLDRASRVLAPRKQSKWAGRLAPIAPIAVALSKGKALLAIFNLKFLFSLGAFLGVYWSLYGMKFAIGFTAQIVIHELGHYIDIKRRGLPADLPVFLPGMGAFVRWQAMGVPVETRAYVSLAGPLAGWVAAAGCTVMWLQTGNEFWAALARSGAWLNLLNLIPVWALDGGQAFLALAKAQRGVLLACALALFLMVNESVFLLIALGAAWRLFSKDFPEEPSVSTTVYFAVVLIALAGVVSLVPGRAFGTP